MIRKILLSLFATLLVFGCGLRWKDEGPPVRREGKPPEITNFYADRAIRPGETWKVYLTLRDLDCDMTYVVTDIWLAGGGSYPVSFTPIRSEGCPEIRGYVYLRTPADRDLIWDQFEVKIHVRDRQGNRSTHIQLPLDFDLVSSTQVPEQWQADSLAIGAISIELLRGSHINTGR